MSEPRPHPWERSYPPGLRWDAPLSTSPVGALLDEGAARFPDRPAIEFRDRRITYREFAEAVDRLAAGLLRVGLAAPGEPVGLYLPNAPYHPIAFFALMKTGARVVHLSPLDAERELSHKLEDSGARVVIATDWADLLPKALRLVEAGLIDRLVIGEDSAWGPPAGPTAPIPGGPHLVSFADIVEKGRERVPLPQVSPEDIALLQYTGGTTGAPKGAVLTHANLTAAVSSYDLWSQAQGSSRPGEERVICCLPLFHIYALTTVLLRCVKHGHEILLRPKFDAATTLADIAVKRATAFPGVPTMWIALAATPGVEKVDFSSLRQVSSGGAPLPIEVGARFERLTGQRLCGGWGMTETAPAGTNLPLAGPRKPGSVGVPLPGVEMDIVALDDPGRVLPLGETGEIRVRGPNVTRGYWNRAAETEAAFVDGFFLTGDIGFMDEDGYVFLVDRKKDMIISGGFNVYPKIVEDALYEHPGIEEAIVIGVPDPHRGEAAKAFVKLRPGAERLTLDALRAFLADKLGKHELPTALEIRDSLPRTGVGKLSKKELVAEERARALQTFKEAS